MLKTEAVKIFLTNSTFPDLAELYNPKMEIQVNVAQDGGVRIEQDFKGRQWHGWTDNLQVWKSFRVPFKANTEPEYEDTNISYDLAAHAEGIGMTGWNWVDKVSQWVGFDFDAISGHSEKHAKKLTELELLEVQKRVSDIPWVTVRQSTSGKGLHLYVFLNNIPTQTHTEHAALARAILGQLSAFARCDFQSKVDAVGGILWVWHRKMKSSNGEGLKLIKQGTIYEDIPLNWREHISVVSGKRKKILPEFTKDLPNAEDVFNEISGQRSKVPLDQDHEKLINYLRDNNVSGWWSSDHWMLVTHTWWLQKAHQELGMKGFFKTISPGSDLETSNCFLFPLRKGGWTVKRYTPGVAEDSSWTQDGQGYTSCFLNRDPDLGTASRNKEGIESPSGGFVFREASKAAEAAKAIGAPVDLPPWIANRRSVLKEHKDGRLIMEIDFQQEDAAIGNSMGQGWMIEKNKWKKIFNVSTTDPMEIDIGRFDDILRHLVSEDGKDCGWVIKSDGEWREEPLVHVKSFLKASGFNAKEVESIIGASVYRAWSLVNRPFQPEMLGDRKWNRNAAQFRFQPTEEREKLSFPTWSKILNHCGKGLDAAIQNSKWAQDNAIVTGGDYLKCWIASMFQQPLEPLPYLFFYGDQLAGKSIFHESIALLVTKGVMNANAALEEPKYNAELANTILAYIEEIDLRKDKRTANRIKEWVTSRDILIHGKNQTPYMMPSSLHLCQMSNNHLFCPIFSGDTRIIMIEVPTLTKDEIIPKKDIDTLLIKEAPDFLAEILYLELPPGSTRLNLPVIQTEEKYTVERSNRTLLEIFLEENCHYVTGKMVKYSEFWDNFQAWLDPNDAQYWSKITTGRNLPPKFPHGRVLSQGAQYFIGNCSFEPFQPNDPVLPRLILREGKLVPENKIN